MQIVIGGNFNIQPHRRLLLYVAPLLKLGGNGGEIAFQYRKRLGDRYGEILDGVEFPASKLTRCTHLFLPHSSKLRAIGEPQ